MHSHKHLLVSVRACFNISMLMLIAAAAVVGNTSISMLHRCAVADSSTSPTYPGRSPTYIPNAPATGSVHEGSPLPDRPNPSAGLLKPSVVIRRGPRGYGFTLRAIRVYYGDSEYYTLHHLVVVRTTEPFACYVPEMSSLSELKYFWLIIFDG